MSNGRRNKVAFGVYHGAYRKPATSEESHQILIAQAPLETDEPVVRRKLRVPDRRIKRPVANIEKKPE